MAQVFFAFFVLFHLSSTFFRPEVPFKYDITDAMLQNIGKMKVQYLMSLLFDLFEILQAVRGEQMNFA